MPVFASNVEACTLKIEYALLISDQCDMADEPYLLRFHCVFFSKPRFLVSWNPCNYWLFEVSLFLLKH